MDLIKTISEKLNLPHHQIRKTVDLLNNGNTIPFIARYRKEVTGNLDEVQIREIQAYLDQLQNLEKRRQTILNSINKSGKLTKALKQQIEEAETLTLLEDLYQPYRPKKQTRAMTAREKGLEPLAKLIINQPNDKPKISDYIMPFIIGKDMDKDQALDGACDIIAEIVSENPKIRQLMREKIAKFGKFEASKNSNAIDERMVYQDYYQFSRSLKELHHHQVLAINRAEKEKILNVTIQIDEQIWKDIIFSQYPPDRQSNFHDILISAAEDGVKRLLLPSIIRDLRREITEASETHAIKIFADNLRSLLTQPPISGHFILGIDPGFRTGCKVAVIDPNGKLLDHGTIYPHPPQKQLEQAYSFIINLIKKHNVSLFVIGNGTASRETEAFISEITKKDQNLHYLITSEAGASVYSASEIARKEFPELDVSMRGAVSIARRVQDPLAELVKIDPKSVGVGLYQHDINQSKLAEALDHVVESVVNAVGVELNTASVPLLSHISGIGPGLAQKIVDYREEQGGFGNRNEILNVPGVGPKTFEQAAGFLRIRDSNNPLDNTGIHPESYPLASKILRMINVPSHASPDEISRRISKIKGDVDLNKLAAELNTGTATIGDIFEELANPGRDPRETLPKPILRNDVLNMDDLSPGMEIKGTIRNVVDFGAFVDIGVKIDGLLHRSRITKNSKLRVGDIIDVKIISIDNDRNRIALSMKEMFV